VGVALLYWWGLNSVWNRGAYLQLDSIQRDFLEDQQHRAQAIAQVNPAYARGYVVGRASAAIGDAQFNALFGGATTGQQEIRPTVVDVGETQDPQDAALRIAVHEKGFVTFHPQPTNGAAGTTQLGSFDNVYWMTKGNDRWQIADAQESIMPTSWLDELVGSGGWWRLLVAAAAAAGLLWILSRRNLAAIPILRGLASVSSSHRGVVPPPLGSNHPLPPFRAPEGGLAIQTLGSFHVWSGDTDLAPELLSRPVTGFVLVYLLARQLSHPGAAPTRSLIAQAVYPVLDSSSQLGRLRDRLRDMRERLPEPLRARLKEETDQTVTLDLAGCRVDALEVLAFAESPAMPADEVVSRVGELQVLIAQTAGEFLPIWDQLEEVTEGRGSAGEEIADLRASLDKARVNLLSGLGRTRLSFSDGPGAIMPLEEALRIHPDREDVARLLADAYDLAGHTTRAVEVRRSYQLVS
jgi:hypothetical protein